MPASPTSPARDDTAVTVPLLQQAENPPQAEWNKWDILRFGVPFTLYSVVSFTRYSKFNAVTLLLTPPSAILNGFLYRKAMKNNQSECAKAYQYMISVINNPDQRQCACKDIPNVIFQLMKYGIILNLTAVSSFFLTGDVLAHQKEFPVPAVWIIALISYFLEATLVFNANKFCVEQILNAPKIIKDFLKNASLGFGVLIKSIITLLVMGLSVIFTLGTMGSLQRGANWVGLSWLRYPFPLVFLLNNKTFAPIAGFGMFFLVSHYVSKSSINILTEIFCPKKFHAGNWFLRIAIWMVSIFSTLAVSAILIEGEHKVRSWDNAWSKLTAFANDTLKISPDILAAIIGGAFNALEAHDALTKAQDNYRQSQENADEGTPTSCMHRLFKWITPIYDVVTSTTEAASPTVVPA